jgi:DNA polymerase (family 10)
MKKTQEEVVKMLDEMAILLEFQGANPFKVRAFQNASHSIENFMEDFDALVKEKKLQTIQGIGKGISADIEEYCTTGSLKVLEDLKKTFPESLYELLKIPNLGPKKVKALYEKLGIENIAALQQACMADELLTLEGFGEKTQQKILAGIQALKNKG